MTNYKRLLVWQKAHKLVLAIYKETLSFPKTEQYNLVSQMRRGATSIPTNIAEGCGKYSQLDRLNYLHISLGSTNEVEYLTFLAHELGYINDSTFESLSKQVNEIRAMSIGLITSIRRSIA